MLLEGETLVHSFILYCSSFSHMYESHMVIPDLVANYTQSTIVNCWPTILVR